VLRPENVAALRQNGVVVYVHRPVELLVPGGGRPLSQSREALHAQYALRAPLYQAACHARVENTGTVPQAAQAIEEAFYEVLDCERA
jgi:shikimate dehydrogenase